MLALWPLGIWVVGAVLIGYLIFRKALARRFFALSLLCCAVIYGLSFWVYGAQLDVPLHSEATRAGAQTRSLDVMLQALMCMMIGFYTFLGAAGLWIVDEALRLTTRPKKEAAAS
jgi:hypothetical protein